MSSKGANWSSDAHLEASKGGSCAVSGPHDRPGGVSILPIAHLPTASQAALCHQDLPRSQIGEGEHQPGERSWSPH